MKEKRCVHIVISLKKIKLLTLFSLNILKVKLYKIPKLLNCGCLLINKYKHLFLLFKEKKIITKTNVLNPRHRQAITQFTINIF